MPYSSLYRDQHGSHDFHNNPNFQRHQSRLAIVDPDIGDYNRWHEMDFTSAPLNPSTTSSPLDSQKYSSNMDTDGDSLSYLRPSNRLNSTDSRLNQQQQSPEVDSLSGDLYSTGPFSYSQLLNMDSDLSSMDQSSISSRADYDSKMLDTNNSHLAASLSANDSINTSPPVATLDPIAISISSKTDSSEKLCPLIAGQVDSCQPQRCGPDAPCMNFTTLPPIEECTSVPCITGSASPNETMITSDSVSVSLHSRPTPSTRNSTVSSASMRRSSASSNDNSQVQSVPLPPRKPTAAAARRRANQRSNPTTTVSTSATMLSDDEEQDSKPKGGAPSKADAKQRAKQAHSLVERKYRENLNAKIAQLHNTLQSSHYGPKASLEDDSDNPSSLMAAIPASKVRKSDVLTEAMNYVNQTEVEMRHMENEINRLSERVRVLEKLVRCEDCSLLKQMVNLQVQPV
ncbi:hypothetical protein PV10_08653 [Exophiala mesophila]|uniref:BHLH domain-containing protein n=1 Tax=Exophiala mesophila TaxID=212818 RepID=A0A0D1Z582_EXOME|nr:uncharacterized protein PV10_08653 [Exophiala mesophila]KIV89039.1 hypothetical protein PV10_08653 [Exophiala mesophila]